jgi:NAD(P)-dependent dehydrogenase (short-subunit alcohol dehydrogenase family)
MTNNMTSAEAPDETVAFITGGTRGIGRQTARDLGKLGMTVVIGARDLDRGEAAAEELRAEGLSAAAIRCDVTAAADRDTTYSYLAQQHGKLDVLINNAGVWLETPNAAEVPANQTSTVPLSLLRDTFEVNFFAPIALTQLLLPLIRKAPAGRIVNLSSQHASLTLHSDPSSAVYPNKVLAYGASKTALNAFTVQLANELQDTSIKVNSADPGWVRTDMGGPTAITDVSEGARTTVQLATLPADGPTGGYFHLGKSVPW